MLKTSHRTRDGQTKVQEDDPLTAKTAVRISEKEFLGFVSILKMLRVEFSGFASFFKIYF